MVGEPKCSRCGTALYDSTADGYCLGCLLQDGLGDSGEAKSLGAGQRFGNYELLEKIGQGGMGVVYRARQINLDRIVAVKLLPYSQFTSAEAVERFKAEASAAAGLQHPNIVAIHEVGEHEGQHYFSMDFIEGRTLAEVMREKLLPARQAATYLKTVAEAVHYAHQHGILHRDLKPSNILIDAFDQPHITDFGLAKRLTGDSDLTLSGQVLGSPNYLPPEQASGKRSAAAPTGDVYSLGAILYHLLTGRPPFQADSLTTLLKQVLETDPVAPRVLNPSVPRDLETVCLKCLDKESHRRYATAQALADDLGRYLNREPVLARPLGAPGKAWRWCRRQPVRATLVGALALVVCSGATAVTLAWRQAKASELVARQHAYAADINLAQRELGGNRIGPVLSLLDMHRPRPTSRIDLRGWEWRYLWQQCQANPSSSLSARRGTAGRISVSADGTLFAEDSGDGRVRLWDSERKRVLNELPGSTKVQALALSPDGRLLAIGRAGKQKESEIEIWDVATARIQHAFQHPGWLKLLAISPSNDVLASFDGHGRAELADIGSGRSLTNFLLGPLRRAEAGALAFSRDGHRLAAGGDAGKAVVLDWSTGKSITLDTNTVEGVMALAFSPDDQLVAAGFGYTSQAIGLFDAQSGELRGQLITTNQAQFVRSLAFSPDGKLLACVTKDRTVRLWNLADQTELKRARGHEGEGLALAFSPNGQTLASACRDCVGCFWDFGLAIPPLGHAAVRISQGMSSLVQENDQRPDRGGIDPKRVRRIGFAFTPDSKSFIAPAVDGTVLVRDVRTLLVTETLPQLGSNVWGVALSPDGRWLVAGDASGAVSVWDWPARRSVARLKLPFEWFGFLEFSANSRLLLARSIFEDHSTRIGLWRTTDWQPLDVRADQFGSFCAALSGNGRLLATGYSDGMVRLWNLDSRGLEMTLTNSATTLISTVFSHDDRRLFVCSEGEVKVWDLGARRAVGILKGHIRVWAVTLSPDGRRLVTGGQDTSDAVKLWDIKTQRELLSFQVDGQCFFVIGFSPDGDTLAATSLDGIAHLWRAPSWAEIEEAEKRQAGPSP